VATLGQILPSLSSVLQTILPLLKTHSTSTIPPNKDVSSTQNATMSAATTQPTPSSTTNRLLPTTADNATTRNDEQHQSSLFLAPNEQPNHSNGLIPVLNPVPSQSFDTATTGLGISSEHGISPSELICPVAPQSQQQQPVSF